MKTEHANFISTDDKEESISIVNKMRSRLFQTPNSPNSRTGKKRTFAILLLIILLLIGFIAWQVASISPIIPPLESATSASLEASSQSTESGAISQSKPEIIVPKPPPSPQPVYWSQFSSELLHLEREQTELITALSDLLPAKIPDQQSPVSLVNTNFSSTENNSNTSPTEKPAAISSFITQVEEVPNSWSAFGNQLIQFEQQRQQFLQDSKN